MADEFKIGNRVRINNFIPELDGKTGKIAGFSGQTAICVYFGSPKNNDIKKYKWWAILIDGTQQVENVLEKCLELIEDK